MSRQKEIWVDKVKIIACFLVVMGHFFQSMEKSAIFANAFTEWFDNTVYLFHVQLFFICSGYLYQRNSKVTSAKEYGRNISKKMLAFGLTYVVFSFVTWAIKNIFSDSVNIKANGLIYSLLLEPISPYWYLYVLFFMFLITPTISNKKTNSVILVVTAALWCVSFAPFADNIYAVKLISEYHVWFVLGMLLCKLKPLLRISKKQLPVFLAVSAVFIAANVVMFRYEIENRFIVFAAGLAGCTATVGLAMIFPDGKTAQITDRLAKYTFPVFLMHTIFAAGARIVLLKAGIDSGIVHIIVGLGASFGGPVIAAELMSRIKYADFVLYPNKYIKLYANRTEVK